MADLFRGKGATEWIVAMLCGLVLIVAMFFLQSFDFAFGVVLTAALIRGYDHWYYNRRNNGRDN